jgi:hypothetical protein
MLQLTLENSDLLHALERLSALGAAYQRNMVAP